MRGHGLRRRTRDGYAPPLRVLRPMHGACLAFTRNPMTCKILKPVPRGIQTSRRSVPLRLPVSTASSWSTDPVSTGPLSALSTLWLLVAFVLTLRHQHRRAHQNILSHDSPMCTQADVDAYTCGNDAAYPFIAGRCNAARQLSESLPVTQVAVACPDAACATSCSAEVGSRGMLVPPLLIDKGFCLCASLHPCVCMPPCAPMYPCVPLCTLM